jgi:hypothetical protein
MRSAKALERSAAAGDAPAFDPAPSAPGLPAAGRFNEMGSHSALDAEGKSWALPGDGSQFNVRIGPDYRKYGKKAPSAAQPYEVASADVIRRESILYHVSEHVTLPPVLDPEVENKTGLPRRVTISLVVPCDAPSLMNSSVDGPCYQIIIFFRATVATLEAWRATACPAVRLWERWVKTAATDTEMKERFKLLIKMENLKDLGLSGMLEKYNGKPALITKSGSLFQAKQRSLPAARRACPSLTARAAALRCAIRCDAKRCDAMRCDAM